MNTYNIKPLGEFDFSAHIKPILIHKAFGKLAFWKLSIFLFNNNYIISKKLTQGCSYKRWLQSKQHSSLHVNMQRKCAIHLLKCHLLESENYKFVVSYDWSRKFLLKENNILTTYSISKHSVIKYTTLILYF